MRDVLRRHAGYVVAGMIGSVLATGGPAALAAAYDAVNSHKVDGKHAVGAGATSSQRAGKLVATNAAGLLPNNILTKALDADKLDGLDSLSFLGVDGTAANSQQLDGLDSTAFASTAHDHDARYYLKAQSQARVAANSLTCAAGQFLNSVAADGTPTCGSGGAGTITTYTLAGAIGGHTGDGNFKFAGPKARITITADQTVIVSISGVIGSTTAGSVDFGLCSAAPNASPALFAVHMSTTLQANDRESISATFPTTELPAGTLDVGLCMRATSFTLNNNDFLNGAVTVIG